tara:strand:+ start:52 stop:177 length:126 start_codon:yes stop_codon:yes gene_type:complete
MVREKWLVDLDEVPEEVWADGVDEAMDRVMTYIGLMKESNA